MEREVARESPLEEREAPGERVERARLLVEKEALVSQANLASPASLVRNPDSVWRRT